MYTYYCTQSEFETINQASLPSDNKSKNYKNQPMYFLPKGNRYQILVPIPLISTSIQKNECVIYLPCSAQNSSMCNCHHQYNILSYIIQISCVSPIP